MSRESDVPPVARCLGVARNATKATVFLIERPDGPVVRKVVLDERRGPLQALGRYLLRREAAMLRMLADTGVVPRLVASGESWLETELVRGVTVASRRERGIDESEAGRLREALASLHRSGYAHGDLGRRDLVFADDGSIVILDVATAIGPGWPPLLGPLLLGLGRRHDRRRLRSIVRKALARRQAWDEQQARLRA